MAKRYSGRCIVQVTYDDRTAPEKYSCTVITAGPLARRWSFDVYPPAAGYGPGVAYDSPQAYDLTARAALAFASSGFDGAELANVVNERAETNTEGTGFLVHRTRPTIPPTRPGARPGESE